MFLYVESLLGYEASELARVKQKDYKRNRKNNPLKKQFLKKIQSTFPRLGWTVLSSDSTFPHKFWHSEFMLQSSQQQRNSQGSDQESNAHTVSQRLPGEREKEKTKQIKWDV